MTEKAKPVLVIGGGPAGITAEVEAAEAGHRVVPVECGPRPGGRVTRTHRFPLDLPAGLWPGRCSLCPGLRAQAPGSILANLER